MSHAIVVNELRFAWPEGDLLFDGKRVVLPLFEQFHDSFAAIDLRLCRRVKLGGEL